jgi:methylmalonyl-CoA/ethylmalonyl-CoA epimerase/glyoxylase I family protein
MTSFRARQVQHVGLPYDDVEATRSFYEDSLGFRPLYRPIPDEVAPGLWFDIGNGQMIHVTERPDPIGYVQHFALEVESLDRAVAALESRGVDVRPALGYFPGGGHQRFLFDPSGNVIELNEPDR